MSGELMTHAEIAVVAVILQNGVIGWGEAPAAPKMTGETLGSLNEALHQAEESLPGQRYGCIEDIPGLLDACRVKRPSARSAAEMALLDALSRTHEVPLSELLGENRHAGPAHAIAVIANGDTALDCAEAKRQSSAGFRIFKLKVGIDPIETELNRIRDVREAIGPEAILGLDANGGFGPEAAGALLSRLKGQDVAFLEQPLAQGMEMETAVLAKTSPVPIAMDESVRCLDDLRFFARNPGFGGASLKFIKFGGLQNVQRAAHFCETAGLSVNLAGKIAETSISAAALAHVAATIPQPIWGVSPTHSYLTHDVCPDPVLCRNGRIERPRDHPGLGINVDVSFLNKFRVQAPGE